MKIKKKLTWVRSVPGVGDGTEDRLQMGMRELSGVTRVVYLIVVTMYLCQNLPDFTVKLVSFISCKI